eukprot:gene29696-44724_t
MRHHGASVDSTDAWLAAALRKAGGEGLDLDGAVLSHNKPWYGGRFHCSKFSWANDSRRPPRFEPDWGEAAEAARGFWDGVVAPHLPEVPRGWELSAAPRASWTAQC